jgi:hypothetical protein
MNNAATYGIFRVQSVGGNVVYEDYNCFVKLDGTAAVYHYSANWPVLYYPSKIGAHTLIADPLFTDAANNDFTLTASSPAIGAGKPDLFGEPTNIGIYNEIPESNPEPGTTPVTFDIIPN